MLLLAENNIAPNGALFDSFLKRKFKYRTNDDENYIRIYQKTLSQADRPLFSHLNGIAITSFIKVDLLNSRIVEHYVQIGHYDKLKLQTYDQLTVANLYNYGTIRYDELFICDLKEVFKWHAHIIAAIKDYLDGGWMKTSKAKENIRRYERNRILPYSDFSYKNVNELTKLQISDIYKLMDNKTKSAYLKPVYVHVDYAHDYAKDFNFDLMSPLTSYSQSYFTYDDDKKNE